MVFVSSYQFRTMKQVGQTEDVSKQVATQRGWRGVLGSFSPEKLSGHFLGTSEGCS